VTATFSEEMDASSISGQTFQLFKKGSTTKIAATVSYDPTSRTATLNPFGSTTTTRLARGTTYKAVVSTGATDMAGNHLDQDPAWMAYSRRSGSSRQSPSFSAQ
jgi:Bacterial Ig-like domain